VIALVGEGGIVTASMVALAAVEEGEMTGVVVGVGLEAAAILRGGIGLRLRRAGKGSGGLLRRAAAAALAGWKARRVVRVGRELLGEEEAVEEEEGLGGVVQEEGGEVEGEGRGGGVWVGDEDEAVAEAGREENVRMTRLGAS